MTIPASTELIGRTGNPTTDGKSSTTRTYRVLVADMWDLIEALLYSVDADMPWTICRAAPFKIIPNSTTVEVTATWDSGDDDKVADEPMLWRTEFKSESFTVNPRDEEGAAVWEFSDGTPIRNNKVLPLMTYGITDVVLYGTRTTLSLASYDAYHGKTNSGTFLGAPEGSVLFGGAECQPTKLGDGTSAISVQVRLHRRQYPWNQEYDEDSGTWKTVRRKSDTTLRFPTTSFAALLT